MARTIWGSHDRFMDVYLKPYRGYYVLACSELANHSSLVTVLDETMKDSIGSVVVLMMWSMSLATD
jgi:hypothetical protein